MRSARAGQGRTPERKNVCAAGVPSPTVTGRALLMSACVAIIGRPIALPRSAISRALLRTRSSAELAGRAHMYVSPRSTPTLSGSIVCESPQQVEAMRPHLEPHPIVFEFLDTVKRAPALRLPLRLMQSMMIRAGIAVLPRWVIERLELDGPQWQLRDWERRLLRRLGAWFERVPIPFSPPVLSCRHMGLPAGYLHRRARNQHHDFVFSITKPATLEARRMLRVACYLCLWNGPLPPALRCVESGLGPARRRAGRRAHPCNRQRACECTALAAVARRLGVRSNASRVEARAPVTASSRARSCPLPAPRHPAAAASARPRRRSVVPSPEAWDVEKSWSPSGALRRRPQP